MLVGMKTLATRIREARKTIGLLQQDLANATGLSQGQISRIESGKSYPNSEDLRKIAVACSTTMAQLCGEVVREAPASYGSGASSIRITGEVMTEIRYISDLIIVYNRQYSRVFYCR